MKVSKIAAAIALLGMAAPVVAQAGEPVQAGRVTTATKGVFIARDGKLLPATAGQTLLKGDRLVTRADAKAQVAMKGCTVAVGATSILPVSAGCAKAKTLAPSAAGFAGANAQDGVEEEAGAGVGEYVVGGLAALAAVLGIYVAIDQNSSKPASP